MASVSERYLGIYVLDEFIKSNVTSELICLLDLLYNMEPKIVNTQIKHLVI